MFYLHCGREGSRRFFSVELANRALHVWISGRGLHVFRYEGRFQILPDSFDLDPGEAFDRRFRPEADGAWMDEPPVEIPDVLRRRPQG